MRFYRRGLFMRIVPTPKDVGLWGKRIQTAFEDMGVLEFRIPEPRGRHAGRRVGRRLRLEQELRKTRAT